MKILTVANQKGGVGKTAVAVHLAWYFLEKTQHNKVLFIDLDLQGNATYTLNKNQKTELAPDAHEFFSGLIKLNSKDITQQTPTLLLAPASVELADFSLNINTMVNNFVANKHAISALGIDLVIIDTPPTLGVVLATALHISDFVLSPIELETYSLLGVRDTVTAVSNIQEANPNLEFIGMLPSKFDKRSKRQLQNLTSIQDIYGDLLMPNYIALRGSIADALNDGLAVWHNKKTAARMASNEMIQLGKYIESKVFAKEME